MYIESNSQVRWTGCDAPREIFLHFAQSYKKLVLELLIIKPSRPESRNGSVFAYAYSVEQPPIAYGNFVHLICAQSLCHL